MTLNSEQIANKKNSFTLELKRIYLCSRMAIRENTRKGWWRGISLNKIDKSFSLTMKITPNKEHIEMSSLLNLKKFIQKL